MKRYHLYIGRDLGGRGTAVPCVEVEESSNGEWVRYEDVAPLVRHKNADWFQRGLIVRPGTNWILTRLNYQPGVEDRAECTTFVDVVHALRRWFGESLPVARFSDTGVDFDFGDDPVATMREVFRAAAVMDDREVLADLVGRVTALENRAAPVDFQRLLVDLLAAVDKEQKEYGLGGDENEKLAWLVLLDRVRSSLPPTPGENGCPR
jgi:hypothetical protein